MDRNKIEEEFNAANSRDYYKSWEEVDVCDFAEHIAKLSRQETLAEVKATLDKMQEGKK
jgi:hypothetical protein